MKCCIKNCDGEVKYTFYADEGFCTISHAIWWFKGQLSKLNQKQNYHKVK